uniref:Chemosensory protein n=2 Tax=Corythucha ciliata TaxID=369451 RepID=A0A2S0M1E6_CORCT|nr:chemosensory protein [Corythucha ciliata]
MAVFGVFLLLALHVLATATAYTTSYDKVDIDNIFKNERLYKKYLECLLDKGPCPPEGKELKTIIPDALATGCEKCTEQQKAGVMKAMKFLIKDHKEDFDLLADLYDKNGEYRKKYQDMAKEHGIEI